MEIGSVKFWRHVIVGTVIGIIIVSTVLALVFGIRSVLLSHRLNQIIAENEALSAEVVEMTEAGTDADDDAPQDEEPDKQDDNEADKNSQENTVETPEAEQTSTTSTAADAAETLEYQSLFPNLVTEPVAKTDDNTQKIIYLTFDDGPSETVTQQILDVLEQYDAHATFFVTAQYGTKEHRSEMYQAILDAGNTIGLHSYSHSYKKIYSSVDSYLENLNKIWQEVYDATGYESALIRFPGGSVNSYNGEFYSELIAEVTRRGFTYHDWVVSSGDAEGDNIPASTISSAVIEACEDRTKSIVLLHDTDAKQTTLEALSTILKELTAQGYEFRALDASVRPYHFGYAN
ncbi:MAG: polysaccharide deacetylase [Clostridiales bacterium]|nr:polysaccharide deacetylase [Clostridiales bacterium]